jgi:starch synthase (maltosyl-transferring)
VTVPQPLILYNLFPTLAGPADRWIEHAARARRMGFSWLYLNPVHYPGFSGSLYAIKDHGRLHPALVPASGNDALEALRPVMRALEDRGLAVMMDLVVNHTSRDCPLVAAHPEWFRRDASGAVMSPSAIDPADAEQVTVWGDLAEVDNEGSVDRDGLWTFWETLIDRYLDLGVTGFRCDAAYKVPAGLWTRLTRRGRTRVPGALFVAETLGCRIEEVEALAGAGFDAFYNSSRWWDFQEPWCLEQHERFGRLAPSIAFPESHDTPRLAAETGGSEAVQRQRYAFAAAFSAGVQLSVGYEFGFRRPLDVVRTSPADWEAPAFDLCRFVGRVNGLKHHHPLLQGEGRLAAVESPAPGVTVLRRWSDADGTRRGLVIINRETILEREVGIDAADLPAGARLFRPCRDDAPLAGEPLPALVRLDPAEVALVMEAP